MTPPGYAKHEQPPTVWARTSDQPRRPRIVLDRGAIVAVAIRIADREGLDSLSMRKLADELGSRPMALYRYVHSRDDLLELMYDEVVAPEPDQQHTGEWREDLRLIAHSIRDVALAHPWAAPMMTGGRPALGPNALSGLEWALGAVDGLGLSIDDMAQVVLSVIGAAQAAAQGEAGQLEERRRSGLTDEEWFAGIAPYLQQVMESGTYPLVSSMLGRTDPPNAQTAFDTTLDIVLDGLERYIERRQTTP